MNSKVGSNSNQSKKSNRKKVLITGATGFIGANLCRALLKQNHEVYALIRPNSNIWRIEEIKSRLRRVEISLLDTEKLILELSTVKPEWIFHCAAHGAYSWQTDVEQMIATNVAATVNLLTAASKVGFESFVYTGSSSEYGFAKGSPNENDRLQPNSSYAVTKAAATHFCQLFAQQYQLNIATVRLYSVYGPYEQPGRLMPTLLLSLKNSRWPALVSPEVAHDFIYIDDVCNACIHLAGHQLGEGEVYNLGTGKQTTMKQLVNLCQSLFPITTKPEWSSMPNRFWDSSNWVANVDKIKHTHNWQPKKSLSDGLQSYMSWFSANPQLEDFYKQSLQAHQK
ncbi:TPA: hypothetical protein DIV55_05095 [Patescibacteria group bacterium]|uniref:Nucleoside-diphosphate-sugar epimerase n=1 Tax=Candidatus Gottesmanbacteria bacterium GW2011_GWA1_43_11 TaxID=1618436 RepID=A0A0G1ET92_9BACT|nr:MAG: Nucleoside-diphosphate-sugar epimerase [Candidatus Gottesmanbacteria bacterium GW2011_GWA1_43_11]HCS79085.1 hypothetical protein [Patescibacteria group bacterium]